MKKILFSIFLSLFALVMNAQTLITTTDVTNINTNHTAFETQIYKDTETNQFYIGLSDGTLKMIGDFSKINSTLSGNGTATSPLGLAQQGATNGQVLSWNGTSWVPVNAAPANTTVSNTVTAPNSITTTVNGTTGAAVNMVTGVSNTSSNNSLSTTVNGVIGANVNIINSISNSFAGGQLTTTVNGVNASPVTLPSGTVTNVTGTSPITVTNGTTTPNISITRNNIVAGTSSNTATNPLVLDAGATSAVVGGANATLTVNNTAPLWNANQLQGKNISIATPTNGQVLAWNDTTSQWTPTSSTLTSENGVDIGYIVAWGANTTPPDYLLPLTGGTYNWSDFPHFQAFQSTYPSQFITNNGTTFTLKDINTSGRFLRGGLTAGVTQNGSTAMPINPFVLANDTHNHSLGLSYSTSNFTNVNYWTMAPAVNNVTLNSSSTYNTNNDSHSHTFSSGGDAETRPINTSVIWCLKVKPTSTSGNITINNITTSETTTNLTQNISTGQITYTNENSTNQTAQVVSSNSNNSINVGTDGGAYFQNPITNLTQNTTTGQITYTNENSTNQTARVVSSNANNSIQVGTDGGAYYQKDEIAIDIYNSNTTPQTLTTGSNTLQLNTIRTNLGSGFTLNNNQITVINSGTYRITFSAGITNNAYNGEYTGEYWLELNSNRVRSSTLYQNCYNGSISCSTRDLILELNAGNTLRVRMTANSNNAVETVPECNSINIEKIN